MQTTTLHRIHEANRDGLEKTLATLARRAIKLGVNAPTWTFSDLITVTAPGADPQREKPTYWYDLTLTSDPIMLAGWTLVGTIDHSTEDGVVLRSAPGDTIPASYREAVNHCDHCHAARRRKETFVVRHDDGRMKQVGRNCLRDFLGTDPKYFAQSASYLMTLTAAIAEAGERVGGSGNYLSTLEYLECAACAIREYGWVSRGKAYVDETACATADAALSVMDNILRGRGEEFFDKNIPVPTPADRAAAEAAITWAKSLSDGEMSDYESNINVVAKSDALNIKHIGLAASIVAVHARTVERDNLRKHVADISAHFGEIKKREVYTLTLNGVRAFEGHYGPTYLHTFTDAAGNIAKWFGSRELDATLGQPVTVKATVKAHDEYKGVKQTMLTRVTEYDAAA